MPLAGPKPAQLSQIRTGHDKMPFGHRGALVCLTLCAFGLQGVCGAAVGPIVEDLVSQLCGPCVRLALRSRKPCRERTLIGREGSDSVGLDDPCAGRPKCRADARAHLALLRFRRDEHSAKSGDVLARLDRVVVRPAARPVVLCCAAQLRRHCRSYRRWIGPLFERDRCIVNVRSGLRCHLKRNPAIRRQRAISPLQATASKDSHVPTNQLFEPMYPIEA